MIVKERQKKEQLSELTGAGGQPVDLQKAAAVFG